MVSERANQIERFMVVSVIALLLLGAIVMVLPFLRAILWAVVFSVTMWPLFLRMEKAMNGKTKLAATVATLLIALMLFIPMAYVGSKLFAQTSNALDYAEKVVHEGLGQPPVWIKDFPWIGDRLVGIWQSAEQDTARLIEVAKPHIRTVAGSVLSAGAGMARFALTSILGLILLFFLLKEGRSVRASLERMALRLGGENAVHLLVVAGSTMRSVVYGILGAAMIQGVLAIVGLWISGVPRAVFIGTLAGFLALIPIGVIQLVLLPAAGWLFYQGQTGWGIFLLIWSVAVVGQVDNVIRPMLISRGAKIPFLVVLLGVLGGLAFGGIIGLFVGATLLAVVYTMMKEWSIESEQDRSAGRRGAGVPGEDEEKAIADSTADVGAAYQEGRA
ncbi:MAG: AI-2E family transporter [bacterium]